MDVCAQVAPVAVDLDPGRSVACHLYPAADAARPAARVPA
jgi:hypothetical protein